MNAESTNVKICVALADFVTNLNNVRGILVSAIS
jgi:hypothetical protein